LDLFCSGKATNLLINVGEQVNKEGNYGYRDEPGAPADKEKEKWKGQIQQRD
jgi:hypothetical protein